MKEVYKLLSEYNELKSTTYTAFLSSDGSVSIKTSKGLKDVCLYVDVESAIKDIKRAVNLLK